SAARQDDDVGDHERRALHLAVSRRAVDEGHVEPGGEIRELTRFVHRRAHGDDGRRRSFALRRDLSPRAHGPLRVGVDEKHARAGLERSDREAYGGRALANSPFLSCEGDDHDDGALLIEYRGMRPLPWLSIPRACRSCRRCPPGGTMMVSVFYVNRNVETIRPTSQ